MIDLNKMFYYDDREIYGILLIKKMSKIESQKIKGSYLKKVFNSDPMCFIKCTGDFILTIRDFNNGGLIATEGSNDKTVVIDLENIKSLINDDDFYYFEIFSPYNDISICVNRYESENNNEGKNLVVLHHFALPTYNFSHESYDLFFKGMIHFYRKNNENSVFLSGSGCIADFNSYFNSIEAGKWLNLTKIDEIYLAFKLKGDIVIRLKETTEDGIYTISVDRIKSNGYEEILVKVPNNKNIVGVEIDSLNPSQIINLRWLGKINNECIRKSNDDKLAIVITAFNEPKALSNAKLLVREIDENTNLNYGIILVDNSQTIKYDDSISKLSVVPNENYGGTGGFLRGLLEAKISGYSVCMFIDDDAFCSPYSIEKAFNFIKYSRKNNLAISGAMFDKNNILNQLEAGAYFFSGCHPLHCNLNGADPNTLIINQKNIDKNKIYGSWWFFMFKIRNELKLPYPYFVRGDDIDFSYKNDFEVILLNGCCSWQDNFLIKETPVAVFLFVRSHILHHITIKFTENQTSIDELKAIIKILEDHFYRYLKQYRYDLAVSVLEACNFVCLGAENWIKNLMMASYIKYIKEESDKVKTQKEIASVSKVYDFYKRLRLWPVTNLTKKYTLNSLLIPAFIKSHKVWEIPQGHYIDPSYLFLKNTYIQSDLNGRKILYRFNFFRTIKLIYQFRKSIKSLIENYELIKEDYLSSYKEWENYKNWTKILFKK